MTGLVFSKKSTDGWVARKINARISIPISKVFARLEIHPNWITLMNLPFVLLMFYFITRPSYISAAVAGVMFQWCSIFDGCDGEVARACHKESIIGGWLDTAMDNLCYLLFVMGLGVWYRNNCGGSIYPMMAASAILAFALCLTYVGMWKIGTSCHKVYRNILRKSADSRTHLDELGRRENFSLIIMIALIFNLREYVYWTTLCFVFAYSIGVIATFPHFLKSIKKEETI